MGKSGTQMSTGAGRQLTCRCSKRLQIFQLSNAEAFYMCEDDKCNLFLTSSPRFVQRPASQVTLGRRKARSATSRQTKSSAESLTDSVPLPPAARPDITSSWVARHNKDRKSAGVSKARPGRVGTTPIRPPSTSSGASSERRRRRQSVRQASLESSSSSSSLVDLVPGSGSTASEPALFRAGSDCGSVSAASVSSSWPGGLPGRTGTLLQQSRSSASLPASESAVSSDSLSTSSSQAVASVSVNRTGLDPSGQISYLTERFASLGHNPTAVDRTGASSTTSQGDAGSWPVSSGFSCDKLSQPLEKGANSLAPQNSCQGTGLKSAGAPNWCRSAQSKSASQVEITADYLKNLTLTPFTVLPLHQSPFPEDSTPAVRQSNSRRRKKTSLPFFPESAPAQVPALPQPALPEPPPRPPQPRPQLPGWTPVGQYRTSRWAPRPEAPHPPTRPVAQQVLAKVAADRSRSKSPAAWNGSSHSSTALNPALRTSSRSGRWESEKIDDLLSSCLWQNKTAADFPPYPLKGISRAEVRSDRDSSATSSSQSSRSPTLSLGSGDSRSTFTSASTSSAGSSGRGRGRPRRGSGRAATPYTRKQQAPAAAQGKGDSAKVAASQTCGVPAVAPGVPAVAPAAAEAPIEEEDIAALLASAPPVNVDFDVDEFLQETAGFF